MKSQRFILSCLALILIQTSVSAQLLYNNGVSISVNGGVSLYVGGSVQNQTGQIDVNYTSSASEIIIQGDFTNNATAGGNGYYRVMENWINNDIFNAGTGTVFLEGDVQQLSGSASTYFYNLTLGGTGAKTQTINQYCTGILSLNDIELKTEAFGFFVQNTDVNAISFGTGFVSSLNGGFLSRQTNISSTYLFPVGSKVVTERYRPVEITPATATANTYTVRMANVDATSEGFDRNSLASEVCEINPLFYHQINRTNGTAAINLDIYYDNATDGIWEGLANWNTSPNLWDIITGSNTTANVPLYKASITNWNDFSQLPYALYSPSPNASISTTASICEGDNILLQETGGEAVSWNWEGPNSWTSTNQNPTINGVTTAATGQYTVTVTNTYGCTASATTTIQVDATVDATITPVGPFCETDATVSLSAVSSGGTWSGNGVTGNSFNPTTAGPGNHTITYNVTNGACSDTNTETIHVDAAVDATITSVGPFCQTHAAITLVASSSGGTWSGNGVTGNSFNPTTAGPGNHTITYNVTNGACSDSDNIIVEVNANPTVPVTSIDCAGGENQGIITVTSPTGGDYEYNIGSGYQTSPTFGPLTNGNYTITVQDIITGCTNVSSSINLDCGCPNPTSLTLGSVTGGDGTCGTAPISLSGNTFGGSATEVTLSHNGNGTLDQTSINTSPFSFTYTPHSTDMGNDVTITITTNNPEGLPCNPSIITYTITVYNLPTAIAGNSTPVCNGGSLTLTETGENAANWTWNGPDSFSSTDQNPVLNSVSSVMNGTYNVTVQDINGCTASDNTTITVNDLPTVIIGSNSPICEGFDINLTETGGDATIYTWTGPGSFTSNNQNPIIVNATPTNGGTYNLIVIDANGCTASDNIVVEVNANPTAPVTSIDCAGGENQGIITVTSPTGVNYQYDIGSGYQASTIFGPLTNGNYTITVQDITSACTNTSSAINLDCGCDNPPTLTIASATGIICGTDPATLAGNTFGGSATEVTLSHNGSGTLNQTSINTSPFSFTYTPDIADMGTDITITITTNNPDGAPCNPVSDTYSITINEIPPIPTATTDCSGGNDNASLTITSPLGANFEYSIGGSFQAETTFGSLTNGDYTITVNDISTGCTSESGIITIDCGCTNPPSLNLAASSGVSCGTDIFTVNDNTFGGSATQVSLSHNGNGTLDQTTISSSPFNFTYTPNPSDIGTDIIITITTNNPDASCSPASDTYTITVLPLPTVSAGSNTPVCEGSTLNLTETGGDATNWDWTGPDSFTSSEQNPTIINTTTSAIGQYSVTITDVNGCIASDNIDVLIIASPDPTIIDPGVVCSGSSIIEITATNSGGVWSGTSIDANSGEFDPIDAGIGNHEIIYTIAGPCGDADTLIISVIETADASIDPVDTLFVTDPPIILTAANTGGTWEGTGVEALSGEFNPTIAGIGDHEIIYKIDAPCGDADTITIIVIPEIIPDLIIPDVLTPNGDGYNDTWRIQGIRAFETVEIVIFNRWGDEVFQFSGTGNAYHEIQNQFNGIRNSKELPFGTYVYLLELNNDKMYKGTLTIIR
ncbi:MAG: gliding motility-associated C-terminal domain-containing protein [Bacteroidales bacterium]|nr:gliding motility-associated C-terminal domain-containing protein [Bacteroidales bacterium]